MLVLSWAGMMTYDRVLHAKLIYDDLWIFMAKWAITKLLHPVLRGGQNKRIKTGSTCDLEARTNPCIGFLLILTDCCLWLKTFYEMRRFLFRLQLGQFRIGISLSSDGCIKHFTLWGHHVSCSLVDWTTQQMSPRRPCSSPCFSSHSSQPSLCFPL